MYGVRSAVTRAQFIFCANVTISNDKIEVQCWNFHLSCLLKFLAPIRIQNYVVLMHGHHVLCQKRPFGFSGISVRDDGESLYSILQYLL